MSAAHDTRNVCIIFNHAAGKRRALQRIEQLRKERGAAIQFWPTERTGHAIELAKRAADQGFQTIAAAGGDGTIHEVANGLLQSQRRDVCLAIVPLGSANDYAFSLQCEGITTPRLVDVGVVRLPSGLERYFVCNLGIGFSGSVTAESRQIKRLQGKLLYGLATLRALRRQWRFADLVIQFDDSPKVTETLLMCSMLIGRREGGFDLAPAAHLDDGILKCICFGRLSRFEVMKLLFRTAVFGLPTQHAKLQFDRCRRATIVSPQPMNIHVDGELFATSADTVHEIEIELLPRRLMVRLGLD